MYVFGGSLYPSEAISSELWTLDLTSFQWTPLFNMSTDLDNSSVNPVQLPVAVRGHTAHMVGSKMVVLFGFSQGEETFPAYIQEYDFSKFFSEGTSHSLLRKCAVCDCTVLRLILLLKFCKLFSFWRVECS